MHDRFPNCLESRLRVEGNKREQTFPGHYGIYLVILAFGPIVSFFSACYALELGNLVSYVTAFLSELEGPPVPRTVPTMGIKGTLAGRYEGRVLD